MNFFFSIPFVTVKFFLPSTFRDFYSLNQDSIEFCIDSLISKMKMGYFRIRNPFTELTLPLQYLPIFISDQFMELFMKRVG